MHTFLLILLLIAVIDPPEAAEKSRLDGTWDQVRNGIRTRIVICGDEGDFELSRWPSQPRSGVATAKFLIKLDPYEPSHVDMIYQGQRLQGIYQRRGNELMIVYNPTGGKRPASLAAKNNPDLCVWQMTKRP